MPTATFMENGGGATQDLSFWTIVTGTVTLDTTTPITPPSSIKISCAAVNSVIKSGILADAGRRISFRTRLPPQLPSSVAQFFIIRQSGGPSIFTLNVLTTGKFQLTPSGLSSIVGNTTLVPSAINRVAVAYTITSASVWAVKVYLDGVLEFNVASTGTLTNITSNGLLLSGTSAWGTSNFIWFDDIYVDDGTDLADPGNISVTNKRPVANGSLNEFPTQIGSGGSGYGTGHAPQVNEQPLNLANAWSVLNAAKKTELFTVEAAAVGDLDISAAKYQIVDWLGWINAKVVTGGNVGNIIVNGVASNQTISNSATIYFRGAGSTTYPSGNNVVGLDNNTINQTFTLHECGVLIAVKSDVAATTTEAPTTAESARGFNDFKANEAPTFAESLIKLRDVPRSAIESIGIVPWIDDFYSESNKDSSILVTASNAVSGFAQSFLSDGGLLASCKFFLAREGGILNTGTMVALLYAHTGVFGSTGRPVGSPLGTSDVRNASDVVAFQTYALFTFNFSGANQFQMLPATPYCIAFEWTPTSTQAIGMGMDSSASAHAGSRSQRSLSTGLYGAGVSAPDLIFYVYDVGEVAIRTIAMPRPIIELLATTESADHIASEPHSTTDFPAILDSSDWIGVLSRSTTD
jgi:hypothetical protein